MLPAVVPALRRPLRVVCVKSAVPRRGPRPVRPTRVFVPLRATEEEIMDASLELELDAEDRMSKALTALSQKLNTVRTGRANPGVLDRVMVEYYGAPTPLKSLAGVAVPDAGTLIVNPFDKNVIPEIEKAILTSDLGLTPNNDGEKIRISVPQLTEQRRKELAKTVSKMCEESKVAVRNVRRDVVKASAKVGMSEDAEKDFKDTLQKRTNEMVERIDAIFKEKSNELTTM